MRKRITLVLAFAVALWGMNAFAGGHDGQGKSGHPTGLDRAETRASMEGQEGIENAESKQSAHKKDKSKKHWWKKHGGKQKADSDKKQ